MDRRHFIKAGLGTAGAVAVAGCFGGGSVGESYIPDYSRWTVTDGDPTETHSIFTHVNWNAGTVLLNGPDRTGETILSNRAVQNMLDLYPTIGYPVSAVYTALTEPMITPYPFAADIFPGRVGGFADEIDGIQTDSTTYVSDVAMVFHGTYDPSVFEEKYTETSGVTVEQTTENGGFTVYAGANDVDDRGIAYAVSDDAVAVIPATYSTNNPPTTAAKNVIETVTNQQSRVIDTTEGQWLFNTVGEAPIAFGMWGPTGWSNTTREEGFTSPGMKEIHSYLTTLDVTTSDGELTDSTAKFAGIYADADATPSQKTVQKQVVGDASIDADITVDGNRVHATANAKTVVADLLSSSS